MKVLDGLQQDLPGVVHRLILPNARRCHQKPRIVKGLEPHVCGDRFLVVDQCFVKPSGRGLAENSRQNLQGRGIGMRRCGRMIQRHYRLNLTDAAQGYGPFAVLRGFHRIRLVQYPLRPGNRGKSVRDIGQCLRFVDFPRNGQHCIVRLIVFLIKRAEPVIGYVLNIGARAYRALPVVVERVRSFHGALLKHILCAVFPHLELIADHRHLRIHDLFRDAGVHHPVRLELDGPFQVLLGRIHSFKVVRAVERSTSVELRAVIGEFLLYALAILGLNKQHVLQQVSHAGFAVAFVTRPDEVGHIHGQLRLGLIGKQQNVEAVRQGVFRDSLDGGNFLDSFGQALRKRNGRKREGGRQGTAEFCES